MFGDWTKHLTASTIAKTSELVVKAQEDRNAGKIIFPAQENIFRALELTPPDKVKVVVLGQDPYHEPGQGNGLAFSVNPGVKCPPSLRNIYKELVADIGCEMPTTGDLTPWAKQGVLLLNSVLTVEQGRANSHKDWGWQAVTGDIIAACMKLPQPVVFLLWGTQAKGVVDAICESGGRFAGGPKFVFISNHPSPFSANRKGGSLPPFIGSHPFSAANKFLTENGADAIEWKL